MPGLLLNHAIYSIVPILCLCVCAFPYLCILVTGSCSCYRMQCPFLNHRLRSALEISSVPSTHPSPLWVQTANRMHLSQLHRTPQTLPSVISSATRNGISLEGVACRGWGRCLEQCCLQAVPTLLTSHHPSHP